MRCGLAELLLASSPALAPTVLQGPLGSLLRLPLEQRLLLGVGEVGCTVRSQWSPPESPREPQQGWALGLQCLPQLHAAVGLGWHLWSEGPWPGSDFQGGADWRQGDELELDVRELGCRASN